MNRIHSWHFYLLAAGASINKLSIMETNGDQLPIASIIPNRIHIFVD